MFQSKGGECGAFGPDLQQMPVLADSFEEFLARMLERLQAGGWSLAEGYWQFADEAHRKHYHHWRGWRT